MHADRRSWAHSGVRQMLLITLMSSETDKGRLVWTLRILQFARRS